MSNRGLAELERANQARNELEAFPWLQKNPTVLESSYVIEPLDTSDDIKVATILAVEGTIIQINPFTARVNKRVV